MGNDMGGSINDLSNISMEESGKTHKNLLFLIIFFCFFALFILVGRVLGLQITSEVFIFVSLVTSLILATYIYMR